MHFITDPILQRSVDSDHEGTDDEQEVKDAIAFKKHKGLINYKEVAKINRFDPQNDPIDKLVFDKIVH